MSGSEKMVSSEQRERLLERHRYINVEHDDWYDCVYADFREDMKAVGISVTRMYFTGFWSQGDGACFEGSMEDTLKYLDHHHKDQYPMIRKLLGYEGEVYVNCSHRGNYYHQYCIEFWADSDTLTGIVDQPTEFHTTIVEQWQEQLTDEMDAFEKDIIEQWRSYMQDLYFKLEAEYDYLVSDEAVWETIEANELDQMEEAA
jgi:hypothetical protein